MPVRLYGIRNCNTMKKAFAWLDGHGIAYEFHDYKKAGADAEHLGAWVDRLGWERVLNRSGTTFRALPEAAKIDLDAAKAMALMLEKPSMIRRPMVEADGALLAGFDEAAFSALFGRP